MFAYTRPWSCADLETENCGLGHGFEELGLGLGL